MDGQKIECLAGLCSRVYKSYWCPLMEGPGMKSGFLLYHDYADTRYHSQAVHTVNQLAHATTGMEMYSTDHYLFFLATNLTA